MKKIFFYSLISLSLVSCSETKKEICFIDKDVLEYSDHNIAPANGLINSPISAAKVAEIIAKGIYGNSKIERQKPLLVSLKDNIWYVQGSLEQGFKGGVVEIEISKIDGKIVRISHGR